MSPRGSPDHVTFLRGLITQIERNTPVAADGRPASDPRFGGVPIALGQEGFRLDGALGGGLRRGALHEIVPARAWDESAASRFVLGVAACGLRLHASIVWIVDDCAVSECGAPYRPGLAGHGLDPDRLVVVRTRGAQQTLWAAEEALRCSGFLVLVELWAAKSYGLLASRRLVLAARVKGATGLLLHTGLGEATRALSTSCETRLVVEAHPSRRVPAAEGSLPVPGPPAFAIRLDKARSSVRGIDPGQLFPLHWNAEQRCFHDPDHPVAVAAPSADRPDRAHGRGRTP